MKPDHRHDRCKCGKFIVWKETDDEVKCKHCKTIYTVDCDSVLVYWLTEKLETRYPYQTDAG